MNEIEQLLAKLKKIEPRKEFKEQSRLVILNTPQKKNLTLSDYLVQAFNYKTAMGATALSVIAILAGLSFINQQFVKSSLVSNLNAENITKEVEEFNIEFSEIDYYENSAEKIKVALNEASGKKLSPQEEAILNNL